MKLESYLTAYIEIDLNRRAITIKLLEKKPNIGVNLHELGLGNDFLAVTLKLKQQKKKKKSTLDIITINTFVF